MPPIKDLRKRTTGQDAEALAAAWLTRQGCRIEGRNVRTPVGEIDLVARDGATIVFVEVRAKRSARFGSAEESITPRKMQHMLRAAQWYLQRQRWREDVPVRLDLIAVTWVDGKPQLNHLKNVFLG